MHHDHFIRLALRHPRCRVITLGLGFVMAALATTAAIPGFDTTLEYKVKAAFLFNFARYTEWPDGSFEKADSPLVVAVLGEDPFGAILDATLDGKSLSGHPLQVRRHRHLKDLKDCHVLFVGRSEARSVKQILARLAGKHVFSVSDIPGFAVRGGTARFRIQRGKVAFEINTDAAARERLSISSQLLKLATLVKDKPESDR